MPFGNNGVQVQEYVYDFAVDGGAASSISLSSKANKDPLPSGAIVMDCVLRVLTAFTSGGSATLAVGNTADPNGYLEGIAVAALTAGACFTAAQQVGALLWDNTNDANLAYGVTSTANTQDVLVQIATAAMTAGKAVICVEYLYPAGV